MNYNNPLDNFRSYSYHFIMGVASSTEAWRPILPTKDSSTGRKSPILQAVDNISLGDAIPGVRDGYLLIDSRRFSQFNITDVEMETTPGGSSPFNPMVMHQAMRMVMVDSTGLSFFNLLMDTYKKMQTANDSAFYLLSIIFVGHKDDGTTETISTCNMPLVLLDLNFEFSHTGSIFTFSLAECEGGISQLTSADNHVNLLGDVKSVSTFGGPANLSRLVQNLEYQLNLKSVEAYRTYENSVAPRGKLVQYMITIPSDWESFKVTNTINSKNVEQMHKSTRATRDKEEISKKEVLISQAVAPGAYCTVTFANTTTIQDALKQCLETSHELLELANKERAASGNGYTFRIVNSVTSDDITYVIHIDVYPNKIPKADPEKNIKTSNAVGSATTSSTNFANLIEYDYTFTGNNSHVDRLKIDFKMGQSALNNAIHMGRSRFASNSTAGTKTVKVNEIVDVKEDYGLQQKFVKNNDPILPNLPYKETAQNTKQTTEQLSKDESWKIDKSKMEYENTYSMLNFMASLKLDLGVRGNPNLIKKFFDRDERGGLPPHPKIIDIGQAAAIKAQDKDVSAQAIAQPGLVSAKQQYVSTFIAPRIASITNKSKDGLLNGGDISTSDVFVKLNIMAPNTDTHGNFKKETNATEDFFTNRFFYRGAYRVFTIKSTFTSGIFRHDLVLTPFDPNNEFIK